MRYEALDVQPTLDQGRTLNLSAGGVLILAHQPLPTGQRIRVVLALPGDDSPIEITGQVGRVRSLSDRVHEVAIAFIEGNLGVQRTLLDYIEARVHHTGARQPDVGIERWLVVATRRGWRCRPAPSAHSPLVRHSAAATPRPTD